MADLHLKGVPAFLAGTDPDFRPNAQHYQGVDPIYQNAANATDVPIAGGSSPFNLEEGGELVTEDAPELTSEKSTAKKPPASSAKQ